MSSAPPGWMPGSGAHGAALGEDPVSRVTWRRLHAELARGEAIVP